MPVVLLPVCQSGAIATLSIAGFRSAYPGLSVNLSDAQISEQFNLATIYLRNDGTSPISSVQTQTSLLYLLTAHLCQISFGPDGKGATGVVGRVNSASEGSVSIGADWPATNSNAWFLQTPYGANFWQATMNWRRGKYIPGPQRFGNGLGGYGRGCYIGGRGCQR